VADRPYNSQNGFDVEFGEPLPGAPGPGATGPGRAPGANEKDEGRWSVTALSGARTFGFIVLLRDNKAEGYKPASFCAWVWNRSSPDDETARILNLEGNSLFHGGPTTCAVCRWLKTDRG